VPAEMPLKDQYTLVEHSNTQSDHLATEIRGNNRLDTGIKNYGIIFFGKSVRNTRLIFAHIRLKPSGEGSTGRCHWVTVGRVNH